jgi:hypothetical protein
MALRETQAELNKDLCERIDEREGLTPKGSGTERLFMLYGENAGGQGRRPRSPAPERGGGYGGLRIPASA